MPNQEGIVCAIFKPVEAWWREGKECEVRSSPLFGPGALVFVTLIVDSQTRAPL